MKCKKLSIDQPKLGISVLNLAKQVLSEPKHHCFTFAPYLGLKMFDGTRIQVKDIFNWKMFDNPRVFYIQEMQLLYIS